MASKRAVAAALKLLARTFAGEVDEAKVALYYAALDDLTDEQLERAVTIVVRTETERFIPPPGVLRQAVAPAAPVVDAGRLLREISKLGTYNANVGWVYPSVERVRDELGEAVAYAYAGAGRERLFADSETTRDIAQREFERAVVEGTKRQWQGLPVLGAAPQLPRLSRPGSGDSGPETVTEP